MSERAPTLTIAPQYERGRAPVAESIPTTEQATNPEQNRQPLTAADFYAKLTEFSDALAAEDETFDATSWLNDPETGSDEEVYKLILDRLSDDNELLNPVELAVFNLLNQEVSLRKAEDVLEQKNPDIFEGDKLERVLAFQVNQLEEKGGNEQAVEALRKAKMVLERDDSDDAATPLNDFYMTAQKHREGGVTNEERDIAISKMVNALAERTRMTAAYTYLAEQNELPESSEVQNEKTELAEAIKHLDDLRLEMATQNARREKRLWGADIVKMDIASRQLKEEYQEATQKVLKLQYADYFADEEIDYNDKVMLIARYTAEEGKRLDDETLTQYSENKSKLGKAIDWYGNLGHKKKLILGMAGGIGLSLATGGFGAFLVSGTALAANFEAGRRKQREAGEGQLDLVDKVDEIYNTLQERLDDDTTITEVASMAQDDVDRRFESRINKEQFKRSGRILGSLAAAATLGAAVQHVIGGGLLFGGGEHAAAVDPSSASGAGAEHAAQIQPPIVETPLPSAETFIGPSNVYVNPGDGFYSVFDSMNIPEAQWDSILQQVGPDLVQNGDAYWMPDGTPGISSPGMLSQHAFEAIMRAKGL